MTAERALFLLVVFLSNIVQCVTGFAGTVLAMPFSAMLVGLGTARPVLNVMGLAASVGVVLKNRRSVEKKELLKMLAVALPGMLLGAYLKTLIPDGRLLFRILGAVVIVFAVMNFAAFLTKKNLAGKSRALGWAFLAAGGVVHGMFVCGGPLIVSYASVKLKRPAAFRATLSAVWIVLNAILMAADVSAGAFTAQTWLLTGLCLAVLAGAVWLGNRIAAKMSRNAFLVATYVLMLISGISLFLK